MYTRGGDKGETSLFGPKRVPKDSARVEAYGTVDELNSAIGLSLTDCSDESLASSLRRIQAWLFVAGADLATETAAPKAQRIRARETKEVEAMTDRLLDELPTLSSFIMPGGTRLAAELHLARSICRRAERRIVRASRSEAINPDLIPFFNRLSTFLFNAARYANKLSRVEEDEWRPSPG